MDPLFLKVLIKKFDAITVSIVAIAVGWFLVQHQYHLNNNMVYDVLSQLVTSYSYGVAFMILGITKLLSIIFNLRWVKIISIALMAGLWVLFGSALYQANELNTVYIYCFGWALICLGVAMGEWIE